MAGLGLCQKQAALQMLGRREAPAVSLLDLAGVSFPACMRMCSRRLIGFEEVTVLWLMKQSNPFAESIGLQDHVCFDPFIQELFATSRQMYLGSPGERVAENMLWFASSRNSGLLRSFYHSPATSWQSDLAAGCPQGATGRSYW